MSGWRIAAILCATVGAVLSVVLLQPAGGLPLPWYVPVRGAASCLSDAHQLDGIPFLDVDPFHVCAVVGSG